MAIIGIFLAVIFLSRTIQGISAECTDYLISGFNGVSNDSITASSTYSSQHEPWRIRLYNRFSSSYDNSLPWIPSGLDSEPFIRFTVQMTITAVLMQGRILYDKYMSMFYIKYSMDGVEWKSYTTVSFVPLTYLMGNKDASTIETIPVNITALYIRIHPFGWMDQAAMRLDLIGCRKLSESENSVPANMNQVVYSGVELSSMSAHGWISSSALSVLHCCLLCTAAENCVSIAYDQSSGTCRWFDSNSLGNVDTVPRSTNSSSANTMFFFNKAPAESKGYATYLEEGFMFRIYTSRKTPSEADDTCKDDLSRLLVIRTTSQLLLVQERIRESTVLSNEASVIVSGNYVDGVWVFWNGEEIPEPLWSSSDRTEGNCVVATLTGLNSTDCSTALFYAC